MLIPRHKTALSRTALSKPVRLALEHALLRSDDRFFDFGCGRGTDVAYLRRRGFQALGWDPTTFSSEQQVPSTVVNLGYVLNVIESVEERVDALQQAWRLAQAVCIVAARHEEDLRLSGRLAPYGDGYITSIGTFQKFYTQSELRGFIEETVGVRTYALAPGIFAIFRDEQREQGFRDRQVKRVRLIGKREDYRELYAAHAELLSELIEFLEARGRLPASSELDSATAVEARFGSLHRAFGVIRNVTGSERWDAFREEAVANLRVQLALDRFSGRERFGRLPSPFQLDIRRLFGSYKAACRSADELLFSLGRFDLVREAARSSDVGKLTPAAWYVHVDALALAPPLLRVYEGCARGYIGEVEGANVVKLRLDEPIVSYLSYPGFDRQPHPELLASVSIGLRSLQYRHRQYAGGSSRKILHRKELLIPKEDPRFARYARLTRQEERAGLYESTERIGDGAYWNALVADKGYAYRGHRLVRAFGGSG